MGLVTEMDERDGYGGRGLRLAGYIQAVGVLHLYSNTVSDMYFEHNSNRPILIT